MPDPFHDELREIKLEQERLNEQLRLLHERVRRLEASAVSGSSEQTLSAVSAAAVLDSKIVTPPPLPVKPYEEVIPPSLPEPALLGPSNKANPEELTSQELWDRRTATDSVAVRTGATQPASSTTQERSAKPPKERKESLEIRVGTFWLVRIGIVLLLTGLAFLSAYLYNNVVANLGPLGKVSMLYVGSGILTGLGFWLERGKEQMRNFGRVVLGGGLAAVYYTTYAAYHVEWLRVLPDPVTATCLLIAWSGFMIWICQKRQSETMAIFSILLAYYASAIGSIFWFSLVANLVLALGAMFLLIRNRWIILSYASLAATYGSYLYWKFYVGSAPPALDLQNVVIEGCFLGVYWILFTAFALVALWRSHPQRYGFASLNNALYFGAVGLALRAVAPDEFWKFASVFGLAVACAAMVLNRRIRSTKNGDQGSNRSLRGMYAGQAICLFTLAIVTYFSGAQLAIILGVEMAVLVTLGRERTMIGRILTLVLGLAASIAAIAEQMTRWINGLVESFLKIFGSVFGQFEYSSGPPHGAQAVMAGFNAGSFLTGLLVGLLALFSSWYSGKRDDRPETKAESGTFSIFGTLALFSTICIQLDGTVKLIVLALMPLAYILAKGKISDHLRWQASVLAVLVWWSMMSFIRHHGFSTSSAVVPNILAAGIPVSLILVGCSIRQSNRKSRSEIESAYYAALADSVLFYTIYNVIQPLWLPGVLAAVGAGFSLLAVRLRFDAFRWGGPAFLAGAIAIWASGMLHIISFPGWVPVTLLIAASIVELAGRKNLPEALVRHKASEYFGAIALFIVAASWSGYELTATRLIWVLPLISVAFIGYGVLFRNTQNQIAGQLFLVAAIGLEPLSSSWLVSLIPLFGVLFTRWYLERFKKGTYWLSAGKAYEIVALFTFAYWVFRFMPRAEFSVVFAATGFALFICALLWTDKRFIHYSLGMSVVSCVCFFVPIFRAEPLNILLPIFLMTEQIIFSRFKTEWFGGGKSRLSITLASGAVMSAFIHLTNSLWQGSGGFYLTLGWTMLAFGSFVIGWFARERVYRMSGLALLGLALVKIAVLDVWRLDLLARIISFMVLGVVLLVMGFVYTKFQNKIRQWL